MQRISSNPALRFSASTQAFQNPEQMFRQLVQNSRTMLKMDKLIQTQRLLSEPEIVGLVKGINFLYDSAALAAMDSRDVKHDNPFNGELLKQNLLFLAKELQKRVPYLSGLPIAMTDILDNAVEHQYQGILQDRGFIQELSRDPDRNPFFTAPPPQDSKPTGVFLS